MRLTKKEIAYTASGADVIEIPDIEYGYKYTGKAIRKLGQLEDAEELCKKVTKQPIYFKSLGGIVEKSFVGHTALYQFETGRVFLFDDADRYVLSLDPQYYGKAWAFTKEELE